MIIMNTRPQFAALPSLLELCEALAFAAAYFTGMCVWNVAESLLSSGIAWAWAVQGQNMQADMQAAFSCLLHGMLATLCQCNLHRLASSQPFVSWLDDTLAAFTRGDSLQVRRFQVYAKHFVVDSRVCSSRCLESCLLLMLLTLKVTFSPHKICFHSSHSRVFIQPPIHIYSTPHSHCRHFCCWTAKMTDLNRKDCTPPQRLPMHYSRFSMLWLLPP